MSKKRIADKRTVYIERKSWIALKIFAAQNDISASNIIERLIKKFLKKQLYK